MSKILPYDPLIIDKSKKYKICNVHLKGINVFKDLSFNEAKILIDSMKIISHYEYFQNKLKEVDLNFTDFIKMQAHEIDFLSEDRGRNYYTEINRLFINFLNSWRIFVEFMELSFKKAFGKNSKEYLEYKIFTGSMFDTNFSYRFFCNLRNFAEHQGYPIYTVKLNSSGGNEAFFDKRILESSYFSKKHFEKDIISFYDYFPVLHHCFEAQKRLQDIFEYFKNTHSSSFNKCALNIVQILGKLFDKNTEYSLMEVNEDNIEDSRFQVIRNSTILELMKV